MTQIRELTIDEMDEVSGGCGNELASQINDLTAIIMVTTGQQTKAAYFFGCARGNTQGCPK